MNTRSKSILKSKVVLARTVCKIKTARKQLNTNLEQNQIINLEVIPILSIPTIVRMSYLGSLPTYEDAKTSGDINLFFRQFERFIIVNEINDQKRLAMLPMQLKFSAETFFNDLSDNVQNDYDLAKRELITKFAPIENEFLNHQLLEARKQSPNESIDTYVESLNVLFKNVKETRETAKVIKFINGLASEKMSEQLKYNAGNYSTLAAAVSAAKTYESIHSQTNNGHSSKAAQSTVLLSEVGKLERKFEHKIDKLDKIINSLAQQQSNNYSRNQQKSVNRERPNNDTPSSNSNTYTTSSPPAAASSPSNYSRPQRDLSHIQCAVCKGFGHFPKECPKKKDHQCPNCGQFGHYGKECTQPVAVKPEQKDGGVRAVPNVNSKFAIHAMIGDIKTPVILDCGAGYNCMSSNLFHRLTGFPLQPSAEILRSAENIQMDCIGVAKVPVEYCDNPGEVEVLLFHVINGLADPILIGEGCIDEIKLSNGMVVGKSNGSTTAVVRLSSATTVPARTSALVKGTVDGHFDSESVQVMEPTSRRNGIIARAVVEDETVITSIINPTPKPIHLKKGEVIGNLESISNLVGWNDAVKDESKPVGIIRQVGSDSETEEKSDPSNEVSKTTDQEKAVRQQICDDEWINEIQKECIVNLLLRNYHIFAENPKAPAFVTNVKHCIDTGNAVPIKQRSYRTSRAEQEIIKKEIEEMLKNGIIRKSESPWSSPIVLVTKKDGSIRFCVDFRKLNDVTKKDSYPLPRINETLDMLGKATIFSSLDLASGYWQIPIDERDVPKTAFVSREGLYEFVRMPFGLTNAPSTFQRAVDLMLMGLNWKFCLVYIDDILIFSETFEQHLEDLQSVFDRLDKSGFSVKLSKCSFGKMEVTFLGHVVGANGVRPDPNKIIAISLFPTPSTLTEVRSFLGSVNYYHKYVPGLATVAAPLFHLQKKNVRFVWSDDCEVAFQAIKQLMVTAPTLRHPDFHREFYLHCDASDVGLGTVLAQVDEQGIEYVVAYGSKALSKEEKKYTVTERECLAVIFAIKQYRPYIYGQKFTVYTDHGSLRWLFNVRDPSGRLQRWALKLQGMNMEIIHRAGKLHGNADALSRAPVRQINTFIPIRVVTRSQRRLEAPVVQDTDEVLSSPAIVRAEKKRQRKAVKSAAPTVNNADVDDEIEVVDPVQIVVDKIKTQQNKDPELKKIIDYLRDGTVDADPSQVSRTRVIASQHVLTDGLLYKMWQPTNTNQRMDVRKQLVVPSSLRQEIMDQMHCAFVGGGHYGFQRTIMRIRDRFTWSSMNADIERYCASCELCAARKTPHRTRKIAMLSSRVPSYPFEILGIDYVGPFPESIAGNKYMLVVTDFFSRWAEAWATKDMLAETVAQLIIEEIVCRYGCPHYLLSDRGSNFLSALVSKMCELLNINKINTTSYHPQANGITERANGILVDMLSIYSTDRDWDAYIPYVLSAYRSSYNSTINEVPYFVLYGNQMRLPIDVMVNNPVQYYTDRSDYVDEVHYRMHDTHKRVKSHLESLREIREIKNNDIERPKEFNVGDDVMMYMPQPPEGVSGKLYKPWRGPFKIAERISLVNYRLIIPDTGSGKTPHDVVHVERLKQYVNPSTTSAAVAAQLQ